MCINIEYILFIYTSRHPDREHGAQALLEHVPRLLEVAEPDEVVRERGPQPPHVVGEAPQRAAHDGLHPQARDARRVPRAQVAQLQPQRVLRLALPPQRGSERENEGVQGMDLEREGLRPRRVLRLAPPARDSRRGGREGGETKKGEESLSVRCSPAAAGQVEARAVAGAGTRERASERASETPPRAAAPSWRRRCRG